MNLDLEYAIDGYVSRPLGSRAHEIYPLHMMQPEAVHEIIELATADEKPPRWREIGYGDGTGRVLALLENRAWWEWHWHRGIDPEKKREWIPTALRLAVIARDGYVCQLCFGEVDPIDVHLDHIYPRSLGGRDTFDNLQVTHSLCNIRKGAKV